MIKTMDFGHWKTGCLCVGDAGTVRLFLSANKPRYYTYVLRRPDGGPFYVGKGKGYRAFQHENEARHPKNGHKLNILRLIRSAQASVIYEIDGVHDIEVAAHTREIELIALIKRTHEGGPLTNSTAGGEGGSDPSPDAREKRRRTLGGIPLDDTERAILNRFLLSIAKPDSIPIKPESRRFRVRPTQRHDSRVSGPSERQAAALVASSIANGVKLVGGCVIPRKITVDGIRGFIENGVSRNIVTSGMATLIPTADPRDEAFALNRVQVAKIMELIGRKKLKALGAV